MTRFQKQPPVTGLDAPTGDGPRPAARRRVEIAAALLIPALVVGIPFVTNYSRSKPSSGTAAAGRPATEVMTDGTAEQLPAAVIGPEGEVVEQALEGLPVKPDSSFWDLYQIAGGTGGGLLSIAAAVPGSSTTSTTGRTTVPSSLAGPTTGPPPTTPSSTAPPAPTTTVTTRTPTVPRAPANLVSDFGSPSLLLRWDGVSTNTDGSGFDDFQTYEISFSARGSSKIYETTGTSFTYTIGQNGLDFGAPQPELTVMIRAVATTGARSAPMTGVVTNDVPLTATAPATLTSDAGHITVTLPSQASIDDLAGFAIYHSTSSTGPFELLASTDGYDSFQHAVAFGTTHHYLYRIRDVFGQVSPGFSPTATATAL